MGPILKRTNCVGKLVNILHYTCGIFGTKVSRTGHHNRSSDIPLRRRYIGSSDIPPPLDSVSLRMGFGYDKGHQLEVSGGDLRPSLTVPFF